MINLKTVEITLYYYNFFETNHPTIHPIPFSDSSLLMNILPILSSTANKFSYNNSYLSLHLSQLKSINEIWYSIVRSAEDSLGEQNEYSNFILLDPINLLVVIDDPAISYPKAIEELINSCLIKLGKKTIKLEPLMSHSCRPIAIKTKISYPLEDALDLTLKTRLIIDKHYKWISNNKSLIPSHQ